MTTTETPLDAAASALSLYEQMWLIRLFEEQALDLFRRGLIRGTVHPSIGQEAIAVGVCSVLRSSDGVLSTYRGHGHCIAKGADVRRMMAELMARRDGYCKGKGGSMHLCDPDIGYLGANGIVGAGMPIAGGVALSMRLQSRDDVAVCFFGDGASNQGVFHETANMAAIWKLPLVLVCENNGYGLSVPTSYACSITDIARRAGGYGFPGWSVDGNDLPAVLEITKTAVARARAGEGPGLIECKTYRWERHSALSRTYHVDPTDATNWSRHDPIERFGKWLVQKGWLDEPIDNQTRQRAAQIVSEAVEFATGSDEAPSLEALSDVYDNVI
ncbi:MAG: thiamine pyrophosphate-dependent dehydrogenase E1 component subunit alpha [Phycisphaerales bacterium]|jgi:pyruvate dehydrogenase E1 component alpha subunit|nr:thiamine pyrophosphate-dependent dehydrogenase E1 component subunit alpha [Phycisphaerales bacterium]